MAKDKPQSKAAKKPDTATPTQSKQKVIEGPAVAEKTVQEQAKEARGEEDKKEDDGGDAGLKPSTFPNEDEIKHKDEAKEARVEHLKSLGIDAENPQGNGMHKVEPDAHDEPMYSGVVTVTSVSGEYDNAKISTRIGIGPVPRGLAWLKYAFKQHFPSANVEAMFEVDPENKEDPLYRTRFG
jgi:hypothetical protein